MSFIDLTEKKFGYWNVIRREENKNRSAHWLCKCDCGTEKVMDGRHLRNKKSKSCGCWDKPENNLDRALKNKVKKQENGCIDWMGMRDRDGYARYGEKAKIVSRLVWEKSNGKIPPKMCICHTCDNPGCVNIEHLWLGSVRENNLDKEKKGRSPHGKNHHKAKINDNDVIEIRKLYQNGMFQIDIGKKYGLCQTSISRILSGKGWKHLD